MTNAGTDAATSQSHIEWRPSSNWLDRLDAALERPRVAACAIAAAIMLAVLLGLGSVGLWGARERRLAACVADIVREGNWLVPHLWGRVRLEKPPLPYWLSAAASLARGGANDGLNEWTLRLPALAATLLIVSSVYYLGTNAGGRRLGVLASLLLLSSFYLVSELRQSSSDLYLAAFSSAALACWWRGYQTTRDRGRWWLATGLLVGLATASKGPVVLVVVGPAIIGFLAWQREWPLPRSAAAWGAIALAAAIGLAWPLAVWLRDPYAMEIWRREPDLAMRHGGRLLSVELGFYLVQWPQYLFPWSVLAVAGVQFGLARRDGPVPPAVRFAWFWFFGDLVVFSLFKTRKIYYLLPAVPALAVLAAYAALRLGEVQPSRWGERLRRFSRHLQALLWIAAGVGLAVAAWLRLGEGREVAAALGITLIVVTSAIYFASIRSRGVLGAYAVAALVFCGAIGGAYAFVLPTLEPQLSHRAFCESLLNREPPSEPLYFWGEPDPSFWFYTRRPLRHVEELVATPVVREAVDCLVRARDQSIEPDFAARLTVVADESFADANASVLLGRIGLPLAVDVTVQRSPNPWDKPLHSKKKAKAMDSDSTAEREARRERKGRRH